MSFVCHLMACGWVAVGKACFESGVDNWLENDIKGPFTSKDTTGLNGDRPVYSIFIASFYFCLTTMCSVGYGDITARNNSERMYVIFLELASSIVFGTSIALITKVITSVDIGAQKEAERLAEVTSFVSFRQFPDKLARRIRRHFRNFYSHKTATDEKKIFSELSTSLRKDVSEYMVIELMGSTSFFMTMSAPLWPRLLPLLQPAAFEVGERVCLQGEDCEEVTVVINGVICGSTHLEGEAKPRVVRTLTKGGSINVLCVLAIWPKCVETVFARRYSETYVVKTEDFLSLFQTDFDVKNFYSMQKREVKKFRFVPSLEAPSSVGMPLYMCCFSSVDITLIKVSGAVLRSVGLDFKSTSRDSMRRRSFRFLNRGSLLRPASAGATGTSAGQTSNSTVAWVVTDLVDTISGKAINEFWRHTTPHKAPEVLADGSLELFCGGETGSISWTDVSLPSSVASIRVRVFVAEASRTTNRVGKETLCGCAILPLQAIKARQKEVKSSNRAGAGHGGGGVADYGEDDAVGSTDGMSNQSSLSASSSTVQLKELKHQIDDANTSTRKSEVWEHENPVEDGEVTAWCEFLPHASSPSNSFSYGGASSSPGRWSKNSNSTPEEKKFDSDAQARDACVVEFREAAPLNALHSSSSSSLKLRVRYRRPEKKPKGPPNNQNRNQNQRQQQQEISAAANAQAGSHPQQGAGGMDSMMMKTTFAHKNNLLSM